MLSSIFFINAIRTPERKVVSPHPRLYESFLLSLSECVCEAAQSLSVGGHQSGGADQSLARRGEAERSSSGGVEEGGGRERERRVTLTVSQWLLTEAHLGGCCCCCTSTTTTGTQASIPTLPPSPPSQPFPSQPPSTLPAPLPATQPEALPANLAPLSACLYLIQPSAKLTYVEC